MNHSGVVCHNHKLLKVRAEFYSGGSINLLRLLGLQNEASASVELGRTFVIRSLDIRFSHLLSHCFMPQLYTQTVETAYDVGVRRTENY